MSHWWPLLGLLSWCPIFKSSHGTRFEGLQMSCRDLTTWTVVPVMAMRTTHPIQMHTKLYFQGASPSLNAGCLKKFSVLQAQLWNHLVLRTILVFFVLRNAYRSWFAGFFAKKSPLFQVKILTLYKFVTFMQVSYECWKVKKKKKKFFLHFVLRVALVTLVTFRHPASMSHMLELTLLVL